MTSLAWVVFALPAAAFVVTALFTQTQPRLSGLISTLAMGAAWVFAILVFIAVAGGGGYEANIPWLWLSPETRDALSFGIRVDSLTALMLVVVTTVSGLVQLYSMGYMDGDPGYARYYSFLSLFTFSMLGLVLAANLLTIFIFWEGVGLCSYLLIGHWYAKPEAALAARKAFVTTRFGDFGFLIGILLLFTITSRLGEPTLDFRRLTELAENGQLQSLGSGLFTAALVLLFCGAVGKSAQFPLHVWLPDAMEGPTPVSALIHAATMVAAGVYLVARAFPMYAQAPTALVVVAWIGGFTAIFAASMGLVANDIKRVMAFSTVSQLGYMMLGLGSGALVAGTFHLFTHAFFKALLFLTAGMVIHAVGTQDLREMGGLRRYLPITFATMGIGGAALAGIPPFSGFWSKDEVLLAAYSSGNVVLFLFAMITVFLTAFYMFRAWFLAFFGTFRGPQQLATVAIEQTAGYRAAFGSPATAPLSAAVDHLDHGVSHANGDDAEQHAPVRGLQLEHAVHWPPAPGHGVEPRVMAIPLLILAVPSVISGFWVFGFANFLEGKPEPFQFNPLVGGLSIVLAVAGIALSYLLYSPWAARASLTAARAGLPAEPLTNLGALYRLLVHKYWVDELYGAIMAVTITGLAKLVFAFDRSVIDGFVDGIGRLVVDAADALRGLQTGRVQGYALVVFGGLVIILIFTTVLPLLGIGLVPR